MALKILLPNIARDPAFAERFAREAQAMAMLSHPHVVMVYDFGQTNLPSPAGKGAGGEGTANLPSPAGRGAGGEGSLYYFLMEFVDGLTLRQLLDAGKLAPQAALAIVPQICEALQYAHDKGVVHRDIKPENILMDRGGQVKIADFGLAKLVGREAKDFSLTGAGQVMGTPHYMAPEQVEHPQEVDHRADIYSLGVVFYQMLTGELPIGRFAPPSKKVQIDVRLDEVVLRALEKEPELRFQQASDVKSEIETIAAKPAAAPSARPLGNARPVRHWGRWRVSSAACRDFPERRLSVRLGQRCFSSRQSSGFFGSMHVQSSSGNQPPGPGWWQSVVIFTILPLGLLAPFGTTALGAVAIAQIRHSAGCLYGLALRAVQRAVFSAAAARRAARLALVVCERFDSPRPCRQRRGRAAFAGCSDLRRKSNTACLMCYRPDISRGGLLYHPLGMARGEPAIERFTAFVPWVCSRFKPAACAGSR